MIHFAMFAKYWETGKVKTRLAASIGAESARDVYELFVKHLATKFESFGQSRTLVFTPTNSEQLFRQIIPDNWSLESQSDGDLGQRMQSFFRKHGSTPGTKNILIGADTPDLPVSFVEQAVQLLDEVPVVIGPSGDGGYYLVAMRGKAVDIFSDIPWSTDQVLTKTQERLSRLKVGFELLPEMKDVDEIEDLRRLLQNLQSSGPDSCDQTLLKKIEALELLNA